jgi:hypothetical protein
MNDCFAANIREASVLPNRRMKQLDSVLQTLAPYPPSYQYRNFFGSKDPVEVLGESTFQTLQVCKAAIMTRVNSDIMSVQLPLNSFNTVFPISPPR